MPEPVATRHSGAQSRAARLSPSTQAPTSRFAHYLMRPILRLGPIAFAAIVIATIVFAWLQRNEGHLTAESGVGYWLGIVGAVTMLLLAGYPLRKRFRFLHGVGRVANWFRLHMVLGILGPTLVILHTNFKLGSLNSRTALFTMLIVVASGIVGRYLYAKVHRGLYGRQAELRDVLADIMALKSSIGSNVSGHAGIEQELDRYLPKNGAPRSMAASLGSVAFSGSRMRFSRRRILNETKRTLSAGSRRERRQHVKAIDKHLRLFFAAVKKAERLAFFESLFGMWHHLHMPLFVLLALTVVIHIVAVHLY
jgi:hypothetical protein